MVMLAYEKYNTIMSQVKEKTLSFKEQDRTKNSNTLTFNLLVATY
jgi:hypothetical protein